MSSKGSTAVGAIVAILIVGAVASIGYYQVVVAPNQTSATSTTTAPTSVNCAATPSACVSVTIPTNAATTAPGFSPDIITLVIGVNNTVVWTNGDTSGTPHTVTSTDNSWGSGTLNQGDTFTHTFTTAGTYNYLCTFHPTVMKGTVIVKAGSGPGSASTTTTNASTSQTSTTST